MSFNEKSLSTMLLWLGILFIIVDQPAPGFGQEDREPLQYPDFDLEIQNTNADLKCIVCNSKYGPCYETIDPISCKDDYIRQVYGDPGIGASLNLENEFNTWPDALSEISSWVKKDDEKPKYYGWTFKGYPSFHDLNGTAFSAYRPRDWDPSESGVKISSFNNQLLKNETGFVKGGFKSCRKMKIVTANQINGGKRQELSEAVPRVIRTCSFVKPKHNEDGFDDKGCKLFIYKTVSIEICYCEKAGCNGSSHLRISHWIIVASLIILVAQFASNRND